MSGVCTGACCVVFPIAIGGRYGSVRDKLQAKFDDDGDDGFIGNMIFPLTLDEARQRWALFNPGLAFPFAKDHITEHFGCRHWDSRSRRCTEYARRPSMCSNYPYARPGVCEFCGYEEPSVTWRWVEEKGAYRSLTPVEDDYDPGPTYRWDGEWLWPVEN